MYRSLALRVQERGISPEDELALNPLALSLLIHFVTEGGQTRVFCEGKDITEAIRTPEISRLASFISKQKGRQRSSGSDAEGDGKGRRRRPGGTGHRDGCFFLTPMLNFIWMPKVVKG